MVGLVSRYVLFDSGDYSFQIHPTSTNVRRIMFEKQQTMSMPPMGKQINKMTLRQFLFSLFPLFFY